MRKLNALLETYLSSKQPIKYAHLIKFERPSRALPGGKISTSKERYAYLTDASVNVSFDDGSSNHLGIPNGSQTYIANKVVRVPDISEDIEAKASSYNLILNGNGLGAYASGIANIVVIDSNTFDLSGIELISLGFREGDKIKLSGVSNPGFYNIDKFRANNTVRLKKIDTALVAQTGVSVTIELSSDEIISILSDKQSPDYNTFINREVFIYRAYFDSNNNIIPDPVLIFKGIINRADLDDTEKDEITITWGLSSHWGDFSQVKGRLTSDDFHRALDSNGNPNPQSALKPIYAYDKGFIHSDTSVNILAKYIVQTEKQDIKVKRGFLGIGSKVKVKKYLVPEDRHTELDFSLEAKSIPVVYGVRLVSGINVFADTLKNDSSTVYTAQALSEGPIGGIYDVIVNGESLICLNKADFDARSQQTVDNTVKLVCRGRADRGDVLSGVNATGAKVLFFDSVYDYAYNLSFNYIGGLNYYKSYVVPAEAPADTTIQAGLTNGKTLTLSSPIDMTMDVFAGYSNQKAASALVAIAKDNNFKLQSDYWAGKDTAEYWGPNHRLLDTAYVTNRFKISDGEETIPTLDYIVRGKFIKCYNYDYSYSHDKTKTSENADNFAIGSTVSIYNSAGSLISSNLQIIDKWSFVDESGNLEYRFRFSSRPNLNYVDGVPGITSFYMSSNGGATRWSMLTYNHIESSGAISQRLEANISSISNNAGYIAINYPSNSLLIVGGYEGENGPALSVLDTNNQAIVNPYFDSAVISAKTISATSIQTFYSHSGSVLSAAGSLPGNKLVSRNTIRLNSAISLPSKIVLERVTADGKKLIQEKDISAFDSLTNIATIDGLWDIDFIPSPGDSYKILTGSDNRVSINPAIQLLDYLSSDTYGKGLFDSLDLNSFLTVAREECDKRSDVTIKMSPFSAEIGAVYRYPSSGEVLWQGKISSLIPTHVTFTDIIGKLTYQWNSWRSFKEEQIIYNEGRVYRVTTAGIKPTAPTHTSGTVNGMMYVTSINLTKVSGVGPSALAVDTSLGNPIQGIKSGIVTSGYSLYDSDGVVYWKYCGWDAQDQRFVTRYQTNMVIDTSQPLFDNTNSILSHFGGMLSYSSGKYFLSIEGLPDEDSIADNSAADITVDSIVGRIKMVDEGIRTSFNSLTTAYTEPGNKFESRTINFFNSEYLKADRNTPKKGNISLPGITNYYNARLLAERFLLKSRFGLKITFSLQPEGIKLVAGQVIQVSYPRYGWFQKKFRIETLNIRADSLVDITATEYDSSFYQASNIDRQPATGLSGSSSASLYSPPISFTASTIDNTEATVNGINLSWSNTVPNAQVEIWRSDTNNINNATLINTVNAPVSFYRDIIQTNTDVTRFYWLRHRLRSTLGNKSNTEFSPFTSVVSGSTKAIPNSGLAQSISALSGLIGDIEAVVDGKVTTYFQDNAPAGDISPGDLWFDTNDGNKQYRWNGTSWVSVQDTGIGQALLAAGEAQDTADGKVTTYVSTTVPTAEAIGDLWFNPSTNILSRWNGIDWLIVSSIGAPQNTSIGGIPVEINYALTPTGMFEDWNKHGTLTAVQRAWDFDTTAGLTLGTDGNMSGGWMLQVAGICTLRGKHRIPYSYEDLYRVKARVYVDTVGFGNVHYVGISAFDANGTELVGSDNGIFHYFGGANVVSTPGFYEWEGYFRGRANTGIGAGVGGYAPDPSSPAPVKSGAVTISPIFLANYSGTGGVIRIDYITIEKIEDLTTLPSRPWVITDFQKKGQVVTHLGRSWIARVDNTGITPPSNSTGTSIWGLLADKGTDGNDGATFYEWVAYANSPDGVVDFTIGAPGDRAFIGRSVGNLSSTESLNPGDYVWSQYKGPPSFGLVTNGTAILASNLFISGDPGNWNLSSVYSSESFTGGAAVSFKGVGVASFLMVGLNSDPTTDNSWTSLDYAFYINGTALDIYEGGAVIQNILPSGGQSAVCSIVYDNKTIKYYANGSLVRIVNTTAGRTFWLDTSAVNGRVLLTGWSPTGQAGIDGEDGIDALIVTSDAYSVSVPCDAGGVPLSGALPFTIIMKATIGNANVTGSTTWGNPVMVGCSVTNLGGGQYRIDSVGAINGKFTITATNGGRSQDVTVTFAKALSGRSAVSIQDTSVNQATTGSWQIATDVFILPFGPGQSMNFSVSGPYSIQGAPPQGTAGRILARFMYRNVSDGGAWTQLGSDIVGSYAIANYIGPGEPEHIPGSISGTGTLSTPPVTQKIFEVRMDLRLDGTQLDQSLLFTAQIL